MDKLLIGCCFLLGLGMTLLDFPNGGVAAVLVILFAVPIAILLEKNLDDGRFLVRLFIGALLIRLLFGTLILTFDLVSFFGGDALTYDSLGYQITLVWNGLASPTDVWSVRAMSTGTPGWGINYVVALIYAIVGRNHFAAQSFCAVVGAATAPLTYICAFKIFHNRRVGKVAALFVGFFPAFVIWSGQLMKDGLIVFLLVLSMTMVIMLQKKFSYLTVLMLIFSLFGILALRFYIFYMVAIAVAGSFVIGQSGSMKSIVRGFVLLVLMGLSLTYLGVLRTATENFEKFGDLERLQRSRDDLARRGESGFGEELDVTTTEGALTAIPVGFLYLMFAPFPWQLGSLRQAFTLPEVLIWWATIPLLVRGLIYTIRYRLREAIPVFIFTIMLTIAYSVFQGNVGTAYRQRTQIQVFLFMFIAVGWSLIQEKTENTRQRRIESDKKRSEALRRGRATG